MLPIIPIVTKEAILHACAWGQNEIANYTISVEKSIEQTQTGSELRYFINILKDHEIVGYFNYVGSPESFVGQAMKDVKDCILWTELDKVQKAPSQNSLVDLDELLAEQHEQF